MRRIEHAMKQVRRADFLPPKQRGFADVDRPLPIGHGQTNSQPSTVKQMLEWLAPEPGHKVLDLGSGSGWTAALLALLVGHKGFVYAVERIPELVEAGRANCDKYDFSNISFHLAGDEIGLPKHGPYARILVSAGADHLPRELLRQLSSNGRMVVPVGRDILVVDKSRAGSNYTITTYHGYVFVPLV